MKIDRWSSKYSFRINIKGLWIGANLQNPAFFIIYNGKLSWQLQTWKPRTASWGDVQTLFVVKSFVATNLMLAPLVLTIL